MQNKKRNYILILTAALFCCLIISRAASAATNASNAVTTYSYTTSAITSACTVTAAFGINTYTITASAGQNGTISPSGTVVASYGNNATFTIAPGAGYAISDVLVDGISAGPVASYTFYSVAAAHAISASFTSSDTPVFSATSPGQDSVINTTNVGYTLNKDVLSGSVTFSRTSGAADTEHVYPFISADLTTGSHSINTGLPLVDGAVYTVAFLASDGTHTGSATSNNVTYDGAAALVTIDSPQSNTYINTDAVSYTLSEAVSVGQLVLTRAGGAADDARHAYTLSGPDLSAGSHTVSTGQTLVNGAVYSIRFVNIVDLAGNPTAQIASLNVTYDTRSVAVTNITPALKSIITSAKVTYTLSEDALAGVITFTRTGGADDGASHEYSLTGAELTAGEHTVSTGMTLVDSAFYTVTFQFSDKAGNPRATASNTMVFSDSNYGKGAVGNIANEDGLNLVNDADAAKMDSVMNSRPGDANWNPSCDLNKDNKIDQEDMALLQTHYGE